MRKVLITGEGRSGTTLFLQFLNLLGFNTGGDRKGPHEFLKESISLSTKFPDVIKHLGGFCVNLEYWIQTYSWEVEHLFYLANHMDVTTGKRLPGGIEFNPKRILDLKTSEEWYALPTETQKEMIQTHYQNRLACAAYGAVDLGIPFSVVHYHTFCRDVNYAYDVLRPVLYLKDVTKQEVIRVHKELIRPHKVDNWLRIKEIKQ